MIISAMKRAVKWCLEHRRTFIIDGPPGGGKTEGTIQTAVELVWDHKLPLPYPQDGTPDGKPFDCFVTHPITDEPPDYKGQPAVITVDGQTIAVHLPYEIMRKLIEATRPTLCLFDDLGNVLPAVQATMLHPVQARMIGEHAISSWVTFGFCTNRREDKTYSQPIIEALKTRVKLIHLEPSMDDLIEYGIRHGFNPMLISYMKSHPSILDGWKGTTTNENSVTSRTLEECSRTLNDEPDEDILFEMVAGDVGPGLATELMAYRETYKRIAKVEDVINDPMGYPIPGNASELYALVCALAFRAKEDNIKAVMTYAGRIDAEYGMLLATDVLKRNPKLADTKPMIEWYTKKNVQKIMV